MSSISQISPSDFDLIHSQIDKTLIQYPAKTIYLGFSGGLDSTVLLHALTKSRLVQNSQRNLICLHVNHGLQEQADHWQQHCLIFAKQLGIDCFALQVELASSKRKGVEATARKARYQAMLEFVQQNEQDNAAGNETDQSKKALLLTAHHQRDQVETLLLNLFRGSGVFGLAAMPDCKVMAVSKDRTIMHARPLLQVPHQLLKQYSEYYQLDYIEDPSNSDSKIRRNFIRNELLPYIERCWPQSQKTIAQASVNMQESVVLLEHYAAKALPEYCYSDDFISLKPVDEVSWLEQKNVIRYWFKQFFPEVVLKSTHYAWLESVIAQNCQSENGNFSYQLGNGVLKVYQSRLYYLANKVSKTKQNEYLTKQIELKSFLGCEIESQEMTFEQQLSFKCPVNCLSNKVFIRGLQGLDKVNKKHLKSFFQAAKIPVWQRKNWPVLVDESNQLLSVLGCAECTFGKAKTDRTVLQIDEVKIDYSMLKTMIAEIEKRVVKN